MITAQLEKVDTRLNDPASMVLFKSLFDTHWDDLALNKDKKAAQLNPQYEIYRDKEKRGELFSASVIENGRVIGYYIGFIGRALHYADMLMCTPDIYYIHPAHRHTNAGFILFEFVKLELKRRGVDYWVVGDKNHKALGTFFQVFGFNKIENYYSMWLGD